jgi:hypothetical protein
MRTKILSVHELHEGAQAILRISEAITHRVQDLIRVSVSPTTVACYVNLIRRQLFSAETQSRETVPKLRFWDCEFIISSQTTLPSDVLSLQFKYYYNENALWSADYVRGLDPRIIPYNDENEDQNVQPGNILHHEYKDELSLDYSVYDRQSTDNIPSYGSPVEDMYDVHSFCMSRMF